MSVPGPPPETIGDYEVLHSLEPARGFGRAFVATRRSARGGQRVFLMGRSFAATSRSKQDSQRLFLIKLLDVEGVARAEAVRAVKQVQQLGHPAIAQVVEFFDHEEQLAVVFKHLDGLWLGQFQAQLEQRRDQLPDEVIGHMGHQVMTALAEAHKAEDDQGSPLLHGHLGPDRIHISWQGAVRVFGVGLLSLFDDGERGGLARSFRAPEQAQGSSADPKCDVYSGAALLWWLLARRPPPKDGSELTALAELRDDLPDAVTSALGRALERVPGKRTITCRDVAACLAASFAETDSRDLSSGLLSSRVASPELAGDDREPTTRPAGPGRISASPDSESALTLPAGAPPPAQALDPSEALTLSPRRAEDADGAEPITAPRPGLPPPVELTDLVSSFDAAEHVFVAKLSEMRSDSQRPDAPHEEPAEGEAVDAADE